MARLERLPAIPELFDFGQQCPVANSCAACAANMIEKSSFNIKDLGGL
jgi:hypothetical protein